MESIMECRNLQMNLDTKSVLIDKKIHTLAQIA